MDGQVSVWKLFTDFHRLYFAETVFLWSFRDAVCSLFLIAEGKHKKSPRSSGFRIIT